MGYVEGRGKYFIRAITAFISGLMWTLLPRFVSGFIGLVAGILLVIKGSIDLFTYALARDVSGSKTILIESITAIVFGIANISTPHLFTYLSTIFIGLYFIVDGIVKHSSALLLKDFRKSWWIIVVLNILEIILGILILIDPFKSVLTMIALGGVLLMIIGIQNSIKFLFYK